MTKLTLLLIFFWPVLLPAAVLEVCDTCAYTRIQDALDAAMDGDEVRVYSGLYYEYGLKVNRAIKLCGVGRPVIDAQEQGEILTLQANDVHVEGFHLRNTGFSYVEDRAGIRLKQVHRFTLADNFLENTFFAIYLEYSRYGTIENNRIEGTAREEANSGNALHFWYCKRLLIQDNYLTGHRDGIYLEFTDSSQIQRNLSEGNLRYGLHFMFSNDDNYWRNTFRGNGAGVAVMFSRRINMWENVFEHNWGAASYGLLLKEIYDAEIQKNQFRENTIGIFVEGATRINYSLNTFNRNGWAIKMSGGNLDNTLTLNNFQSNTFDLAMNSGPTGNTFDGNYWSAYEGYDLDRDGVGDVPYRPVKLFNYVVNRTPEAMVLLRSTFVDLLNFSEKVSPVFTPANVLDEQPSMHPIATN